MPPVLPVTWARFSLGCLLLAGVPEIAVTAEPAPLIRGSGLCQFVLHRYALPIQTEAQVNQIVGDALKQHQNLFGLAAIPGFRVRIRIFGRFEDYQQFARTNIQAHGGTPPALNYTNVAGYYSTLNREIVTWRQQEPSYLANNILHESSHAILHAYFQRVPPWLLEGCGTYFAFPHYLQDTNDVASLKGRWALLRAWLRQRTLPPLPWFVNLDQEAWHALRPEVSYTVSWSLFQFLMSTPQNRQVLQKLMRGMQADPQPGACAALLAALYPGGIKQLEENWHRWIVQTAVKVLGPATPPGSNPNARLTH